MNKMLLLLLTTTTGLILSGCSSYPDSAKGVAQNICKEFKKADLEAMKIYMSSDALLQMKERRQELENLFKSPEFEQMKSSYDCNAPSKTKELDHGRLKIYFGNQLKVKVKVINGQWKMVI